MLLVNENHQQINVDELKASLKEIDTNEVPTQEDLEKELGNYYGQALQTDTLQYGLQGVTTQSFATQAFSPGGIGGKILAAIKKFICGILDGNSTEDEIIDAILNAIASIIPGGVILKPIVEKIVKYIISQGISAFCAVPAAA